MGAPVERSGVARLFDGVQFADISLSKMSGRDAA